MSWQMTGRVRYPHFPADPFPLVRAGWEQQCSRAKHGCREEADSRLKSCQHLFRERMIEVCRNPK